MSPFFQLNNRFWQIDRQHTFTAHETRLFFYLLNVANEAGWPLVLTHSDKRTCANASLSANGMKNARTRLEEAGLFAVEAGGKGKGDASRYHFRYHEVTPKVIPNLTPRTAKVSPKVSVKVSPDDTYSIYKRLKTVYTLTNGRVRKKIIRFRRLKKREKKAPLIPRTPPPVGASRPMPKWGDPFTLKSDSEQLNVPYSQWKALYPIDGNETQLRKLWLGLEEGERQKALTHTPDYVKSAPERFLKAPANYLEQKQFNDRIIDRNGKSTTTPSQTGRIEPLPGQSFGAWSGHRFGRPPEPDERQAG